MPRRPGDALAAAASVRTNPRSGSRTQSWRDRPVPGRHPKNHQRVLLRSPSTRPHQARAALADRGVRGPAPLEVTASHVDGRFAHSGSCIRTRGACAHGSHQAHAAQAHCKWCKHAPGGALALNRHGAASGPASASDESAVSHHALSPLALAPSPSLFSRAQARARASAAHVRLKCVLRLESRRPNVAR